MTSMEFLHSAEDLFDSELGRLNLKTTEFEDIFRALGECDMFATFPYENALIFAFYMEFEGALFYIVAYTRDMVAMKSDTLNFVDGDFYGYL